MTNRKEQIPGPSKATDGVSIIPGRALVPSTNWQALKREFLLDPDYASPRLWLLEVKMWDRKKIVNGNTIHKVAGWRSLKARLEQRKTEQAITGMLEEQRKRIPELLKAKLNLVAQIIRDVGRWDRLQPIEKKLCFEILKTELGEPTSIKTVGLITPKDPVQTLLEEYGLMKEGRIILDGEPAESTGDNPPAPALDSGSPAQVPQNPAV